MKGCRVLTDDEIRLVLNELGIRDRVLFLTCLTFGTRISEALELTFADVAGSTLYIKSKKGSENQGFPIPNSYKQEVTELGAWYTEKGINVKGNLPLFVSQKGRNCSITRQLASNVIKRVTRRVKLDGKINTHSFRKSFVTKIYEMTGFNIAETKAYSRHKSLVNLEYYIKTTESTDLVEQLCWV
jgi:integrase